MVLWEENISIKMLKAAISDVGEMLPIRGDNIELNGPMARLGIRQFDIYS